MLKFLPGGIGGGIAVHVDEWRGLGLFGLGVGALFLAILAMDCE